MLQLARSTVVYNARLFSPHRALVLLLTTNAPLQLNTESYTSFELVEILPATTSGTNALIF